VAVFPTASLHAEAHFTFLPENSLEPLSKGSDKYRSLDQIAAEMYVICTLLGEVTDNETFGKYGGSLPVLPVIREELWWQGTSDGQLCSAGNVSV
jgi:hypothetical protein